MVDYHSYSKEELIKIIQSQEQELESKKYGLVWDKEREPEKVVLDCASHLPILKEVRDKHITTDESEDNILIEGDNYHALSVLNYTHKNRIDVIYIDPPYNTGNKDFIYNDRFVDKEDKYRHSKWLNFMEKRLNLAYELLKEDGVIFISIDDNEAYNLKLLCDKIFGEGNFVALCPRVVKKGGKSSDKISKNNDYILVYQKTSLSQFLQLPHIDKGFKFEDKHVADRGLYKLNQTLDYDSIQYSKTLDYEIEIDDEKIYAGGVSKTEMFERQVKNPERDFCWRWSKKLFEFGLQNDFIVVKKYKNKKSRIYTKTYQNATISKNNQGEYYVEILPRGKNLSTLDLIENEYSNDNAKKELKKLFGNVMFDYPKPTSLIKLFSKISANKDSIILDFFAGSGTTGQAILEANHEDGGNRKFILCTNNENGICQSVTYPRISKVINGYINAKGQNTDGLSGNLKYFKTALLPKGDSPSQMKINLTNECSEMLCIKEGIYNLELEQSDFKIYSANDKKRFLCVYFNTEDNSLKEFLAELKKIKSQKVVYMFSQSEEVDLTIFKGVKDFSVEAIPQKILNIYKQLVKQNISPKTNTIFVDLQKAKRRIFEEKDKDDGASKLRVVLEQIIEVIAHKNSINLNEYNSISRVNTRLKDDEVFSKVLWKENEIYLTIGNDASHGDYDNYEIKQVESFYAHVQKLIKNFGIGKEI